MTAESQPAGYAPERVTEIALRPRWEHAGPRLRVGIHGLSALAEEALAHWFRVRGLSPPVLSERYGRELCVVDCTSVCGGLVSLDDEVAAAAHPVGVRAFSVRLGVRDGDVERVPLRSWATLALLRRPGRFATPPDELSGLLVDDLDAGGAASSDDGAGWRRAWRVPLGSCHHAGRLSHAALLRVATDLAERFAEDRGLPARRLLDERGLVAVVPRVRIRLLAEARVGDVLTARYHVRGVAGRGSLLDGGFDAHVERDGRRVQVAAGSLLQGFAHVDDPAGTPVDLDPEVARRLTGP